MAGSLSNSRVRDGKDRTALDSVVTAFAKAVVVGVVAHRSYLFYLTCLIP